MIWMASEVWEPDLLCPPKRAGHLSASSTRLHFQDFLSTEVLAYTYHLILTLQCTSQRLLSGQFDRFTNKPGLQPSEPLPQALGVL